MRALPAPLIPAGGRGRAWLASGLLACMSCCGGSDSQRTASSARSGEVRERSAPSSRPWDIPGKTGDLQAGLSSRHYRLKDGGDGWVVSRRRGGSLVSLVNLCIRVGDLVTVAEDSWQPPGVSGWPAVNDYRHTMLINFALEAMVSMAHDAKLDSLVASGQLTTEMAEKGRHRGAREAREWFCQDFRTFGRMLAPGTPVRVTGLVYDEQDSDQARPAALRVQTVRGADPVSAILDTMTIAEVAHAFRNESGPHKLHEVPDGVGGR